TWGLARALEAAGARRTLDVTWVDEDRQALELAAAIARRREGRGRVALRVRALSPLGGALDGLGRFDVVLAGQVLSELDVGSPDPWRAERHADRLDALVDRHTEPGGAVIVIEPALRDRTRHLHRVRDVLAARGTAIFAPCLHAAACPALARPSDWCHEDVPVDLPPWLVPVARAAGLRHQGLTFSYLVLRRNGARLADALPAPAGAARLRVVSTPIRTKGKREVFLCGELAATGTVPNVLVPGGVRAMRLDRDARPANAAWEELNRGDVISVTPAIGHDCPRVLADTRIDRFGETESR
ncbi:MAG: small ribosomal subunit Rsm22 family protein, partial [Myxococcota bacterium]|nr:small ribosomal subunit Rsm22 family protein [Myxococcota bacterium]